MAHATTRCPQRKVYGITLSANEGLLGGWAEYIYLRPGVRQLADNLAARVAVAPKTRDRRALALANFSYGRTKRLRGVYWGHFVEFGTKRGIKPGRFMQRAIQANAQQVINIFADDIEAQIRRQLA